MAQSPFDHSASTLPLVDPLDDMPMGIRTGIARCGHVARVAVEMRSPEGRLVQIFTPASARDLAAELIAAAVDAELIAAKEGAPS